MFVSSQLMAQYKSMSALFKGFNSTTTEATNVLDINELIDASDVVAQHILKEYPEINRQGTYTVYNQLKLMHEETPHGYSTINVSEALCSIKSYGRWLILNISDITGMPFSFHHPSNFIVTSDIFFSPDNSQLACDAYGDFAVFDTKTWAVLHRTTLTHETRNVAWSLDHTKCACIDRQDTTIIWDTTTQPWSIIQEKSGFHGPFAFSPDGSQYAVENSKTQTLMIFGTNTNMIHCVPTESGIQNLSWSPDGTKLAVFLRKNGFVVYDARTWEIITRQKLPSQQYSTQSCSWNHTSTKLAIGLPASHYIIIFDTQTWRTLNTLYISGKNYADHIAWGTDDTHIISGNNDGEICIWNLESNKTVLSPTNTKNITLEQALFLLFLKVTGRRDLLNLHAELDPSVAPKIFAGLDQESQQNLVQRYTLTNCLLPVAASAEADDQAAKRYCSDTQQ